MKMTSKQVFLTNTTVDEAWSRWHDVMQPAARRKPDVEEVDVTQGLGRVLAEPVYARRSSPHFLAAAMDGIAVRAASTVSADLSKPLILELEQDAFWIDTGDPLPPGFDAVIMVEALNPVSDREVEIVEPAVPWQHVRGIGEDIVEQDLLLTRYRYLKPADLAALLSVGYQSVRVLAKPRVAIIPTGDELVPPSVQPQPGQITESNSTLFTGLVQEYGGEPIVYPIVPDKLDCLKQAVLQASKECELVILNAGSSHGRDDYTATVVAELGRIAVHGVSIRPGKPVVLGVVNQVPVIGVPGYPVSGALVLDLFVKPLLASLLRQPVQAPDQLECKLTRPLVSSIGNREFVRVRVGLVGDSWVATPLGRGAGALTSLVKADGYIAIPEESEGYRDGHTVRVNLSEKPETLASRLVCIGSHDVALDVLAESIREQDEHFQLSSTHVGSLAGLMALKRGEAHLAGTHLFDPQTGEYNTSYLAKLFAPGEISLHNLVQRQQGLMLPTSLLRDVQNLDDVSRLELRFVNRQRGSGTRILLDHMLAIAGLAAPDLRGYEREESSHFNVAAAIAAGTAEVGLGILAAAQAFGLAFVPLVLERYDLAIPTKHLGHPGIVRLLNAVKDEPFREAVERLGGYCLSLSGQEMGDGDDA